jgi:hypothetical protein
MTTNGYTTLASLMGQHPEVAILRRFGTLNMQTLLYLQAELVGLELKLKRHSDADKSSGHIERTIYDRDWQSLSESATGSGNSEQWETVLSIRRVLKEYSKSHV